jgi:hypothetical protein
VRWQELMLFAKCYHPLDQAVAALHRQTAMLAVCSMKCA